MDLWKTELSLTGTDKIEFTCTKVEEDTRFDKKEDVWIGIGVFPMRIPRTFKAYHIIGQGIVVRRGFTYEPSKEELEDIKMSELQLLRQYVKEEYKHTKTNYEKKLHTINLEEQKSQEVYKG